MYLTPWYSLIARSSLVVIVITVVHAGVILATRRPASTVRVPNTRVIPCSSSLVVWYDRAPRRTCVVVRAPVNGGWSPRELPIDRRHHFAVHGRRPCSILLVFVVMDVAVAAAATIRTTKTTTTTTTTTAAAAETTADSETAANDTNATTITTRATTTLRSSADRVWSNRLKSASALTTRRYIGATYVHKPIAQFVIDVPVVFCTDDTADPIIPYTDYEQIYSAFPVQR